jgi:hypothetical protein
VRKDHPPRAIRAMLDEVLTQLSRRFDTMYASEGRGFNPLNRHHFDDRRSSRLIALSQNWSAAGDGTCSSSTVMPCFLSILVK